MSLIITIGREFGSGGRELGRRLADELGIAYYDKEIIRELQKNTPYCQSYLEEISEDRPAPLLPIHYGNSLFPTHDPSLQQAMDVYAAQSKILHELAEKSSCVIIGRAADYILRDLKPFRIFVYANMETKMARCREKGEDANLPDRKLAKLINRVNNKRKHFYNYYSDLKFGEKENYDLMINSTGVDIKKLAKDLAKYFKDLSR